MGNPGASADEDMPVVCFTGAACFWPHLAYSVLELETYCLLTGCEKKASWAELDLGLAHCL